MFFYLYPINNSNKLYSFQLVGSGGDVKKVDYVIDLGSGGETVVMKTVIVVVTMARKGQTRAVVPRTAIIILGWILKF